MDDRRYEDFEKGVAGLKLNVGTRAEMWYARVGVVAAVAGPMLGVVAYVGSVSTDNPRGQTDMIVLGLLGVALTILGIGLFLRYSVVRFFRFWAARIVYELDRRVTEPETSGNAESTVSADSSQDMRVSVPGSGRSQPGAPAS